MNTTQKVVCRSLKVFVYILGILFVIQMTTSTLWDTLVRTVVGSFFTMEARYDWSPVYPPIEFGDEVRHIYIFLHWLPISLYGLTILIFALLSTLLIFKSNASNEKKFTVYVTSVLLLPLVFQMINSVNEIHGLCGSGWFGCIVVGPIILSATILTFIQFLVIRKLIYQKDVTPIPRQSSTDSGV